MRLLSHLVGTAVIFLSILLIAWGLAYVIHKLNEAHNFPPEIYAVVTGIELAIIYIDVGLSSIVLLFGAVRFLKEAWEDS